MLHAWWKVERMNVVAGRPEKKMPHDLDIDGKIILKWILKK
jgi:hypothetical protein